MTSLSLPPSGRLPSSQPEEGPKCSADPSHDTQDRSPFIAPVFGTISNKDVPILSSKGKGTAAADPLLTAAEHKSNKSEESIKRRVSKAPGGIKRRQSDISDSEQEEELDTVGGEKKELSSNSEEAARRLAQDSRGRRSVEDKEDGAGAESSEDSPPAGATLLPDHLGVQLPQNPAARSTFLSCLHSKPRVVLRRLSGTPRGGNSSDADQEERRPSPLKTSARGRASGQRPKSDVDLSSSRNKE